MKKEKQKIKKKEKQNIKKDAKINKKASKNNPPTLIDFFTELHKKDDEQISMEMQERRKFVFDEYKGNIDIELLSPKWKNMNTILLVTYVYLICSLLSILLHYEPFNPSDKKLRGLLFGFYKYLHMALIYATSALLLKLFDFQCYLPSMDLGLHRLGFRRRYVYCALIVLSSLYLCVGFLGLAMSMDLVKLSNRAEALATEVLSMSSLIYQRWFDVLEVLSTPLVFNVSGFVAFVSAGVGARLCTMVQQQPMTIKFID